MKGIAIVTGASSGIGEAFIKKLIEEDYSGIWIVARRKDKLLTLKSLLGDDRVIPIEADLTSDSGMALIKSRLEDCRPDVALLINCAGMGTRKDIADTDTGLIAATVDLNCTALSVLTGICLPYMHEGARIINIASSAGFLPQPGFAVYAASKSYVISFSRALDVELKKRGICVTCVAPGPVNTEFQSKATDGKDNEFKGFRKLVVVSPDKLAAASLKASAAGRHLYVYGFSQKLLHVASKIVPHYWIMKIERFGK